MQMKRILIFSNLLLLSLLLSTTQSLASGWQMKKGEKLTYKVAFHSGLTGNIKGGEASIQVAPNIKIINGVPTNHASMQFGTTGFIEKLFRVDNRYESFMDVNTGTPHLFKQKIVENKYTRNDSVVFDHKNKLAKNISRNESTKIKNNTYDFVSMIFYVRSMDVSKLKKGDSFTISFYSTSEVINSKIVYAGVEKIKVNNKEVECHAYKPEVPEGKLFNKDNPATIWFSTDNKRTPMLIEAKIRVGKIKMELMQ